MCVMVPLLVFCLVTLAAGVNSACVDSVSNCHLLDEVYCQAPYQAIARDVCAKRCGLCDDNSSSLKKRAHNQGPDWAAHCWDHNANAVTDPFCALLTTTTTPKPTTPTTTPKPTTPEPTTTTTEATTTTTQPTTTTTPLPPTTTERSCYYLEFNETDITSTDFGTDIQLIQNTNITINESVHLIGDVDFCQGVCAQSLLNDGFECWGFTYNEVDRCYLYYYTQPLVIEDLIEANQTTLYVKRCSDDPITTPRPTTPTTQEMVMTTVEMTTPEATPPPPTTTQETKAPLPTTMPITTMETAPPTKSVATAPPTKATTTEKIVSETSGVPPLMTTTEASTTQTSGTQTGPNTSAPGGVQIVSANTYKINGVPSPVADACFFLNQTFFKGEHWKDTCKYDCMCNDPSTNTALCTDVCPHYTELPAGCNIVQESGQCCSQLKCDNDTLVNSTEGSGNVSDCMNKIDTCDYYEDNSCVGLYAPWAQDNCPVRCGYCGNEPCLDRISFCNLYDLDDACPNYRGWARHYCRKSCDVCLRPVNGA